jgi:hypothetical protein
MSTQLLERPKVNAKDSTTSAIDDRQFHTITSDDVKRLNELFYRQQCALSRTAVSGVALGVGAVIVSGGGAFAQTGGGGGGGSAADAAAESIEAGVQNAITMIENVDGIALAAFGGALAPMGFMLVLRVLNMVLSRV